MKKKTRGRKIFDGKNVEDIILKLEQVWAVGGSDKEASFYADISPTALSDYLKKHPKISERKEALLNKPIFEARQEVVKGIKNNPEFALKFLERKLPNEFGLKNRTELTGIDGNKLEITIRHFVEKNENRTSV